MACGFEQTACTLSNSKEDRIVLGVPAFDKSIGGIPITTVQVVAGINTEASGLSNVVVRLCRELLARGENLCLVTSGQNGLSSVIPFAETYPVHPAMRRLRLSPKMHERLMRAANESDILHVNSLWTMPCIYPGWAVRGKPSRLVVSPHGTLSGWALNYSRWKKRVFWALLQGRAVRDASCFHATAEIEYADIRAAGLQAQPVCIIPNGVDVPEPKPKPTTARRVLLYLGRIHPKKGLDVLLQAWAAVAERFPEWELRIVGPDNVGYLKKMQLLAGELRLKRVNFYGPLFGEAKLAAYREAELFVLPTHSENFGMTVAESLAAGTAAIVSKGAPWSGLEEHDAGWWIDMGLDPLVASLEDAMSRSREELVCKGLSGRDWMIRDYSWPRIGRMMHITYKWLLSGGKRPEWVRLD